MMICGHCDEEVLKEEIWGSLNGKPAHQECLFRLGAGSAAHILRECSCFGGTRDDPPGMTKRQAAKLALDTYRAISEGL
jgi:hypothetical protein